MDRYTIRQVAEMTGLTTHALRYYEAEGLLSPDRDHNKRRLYTEADLEWIRFIQRLRETGMPVRDMRRYSDLRAAGDATLGERMEMLAAHRQKLDQKMRKLEEDMAALDGKIAIYKEKMAQSATQVRG